MASNLDFIAPTGADDMKKDMSAHWMNYINLVKTYVEGDEEAFMWVSFREQLQRAENQLMNEVCKTSPNAESMLEIFRASYNRSVAEIKMIKRRGSEFSKSRLSVYESEAAQMLQMYNEELEQQQRAAALIQSFYKNHK
jgi:hypothetical protein